jgi:hypothetical protein
MAGESMAAVSSLNNLANSQMQRGASMQEGVSNVLGMSSTATSTTPVTGVGANISFNPYRVDTPPSTATRPVPSSDTTGGMAGMAGMAGMPDMGADVGTMGMGAEGSNSCCGCYNNYMGQSGQTPAEGMATAAETPATAAETPATAAEDPAHPNDGHTHPEDEAVAAKPGHGSTPGSGMVGEEMDPTMPMTGEMDPTMPMTGEMDPTMPMTGEMDHSTMPMTGDDAPTTPTTPVQAAGDLPEQSMNCEPPPPPPPPPGCDSAAGDMAGAGHEAGGAMHKSAPALGPGNSAAQMTNVPGMTWDQTQAMAGDSAGGAMAKMNTGTAGLLTDTETAAPPTGTTGTAGGHAHGATGTTAPTAPTGTTGTTGTTGGHPHGAGADAHPENEEDLTFGNQHGGYVGPAVAGRSEADPMKFAPRMTETGFEFDSYIQGGSYAIQDSVLEAKDDDEELYEAYMSGDPEATQEFEAQVAQNLTNRNDEDDFVDEALGKQYSDEMEAMGFTGNSKNHYIHNLGYFEAPGVDAALQAIENGTPLTAFPPGAFILEEGGTIGGNLHTLEFDKDFMRAEEIPGQPGYYVVKNSSNNNDPNNGHHLMTGAAYIVKGSSPENAIDTAIQAADDGNFEDDNNNYMLTEEGSRMARETVV